MVVVVLLLKILMLLLRDSGSIVEWEKKDEDKIGVVVEFGDNNGGWRVEVEVEEERV